MNEEQMFPDYFEFDGPIHRHSWRRSGYEDGEVVGTLTSLGTGESGNNYPLSYVRAAFEQGAWYFAEGFDYVKSELEFPDEFQFWNKDEKIVYTATKITLHDYLVSWNDEDRTTLTVKSLRNGFDNLCWEFYEPPVDEDSIRIVKTCFVTIDGVTYKAEGDDVAKLTDLHAKYQQLKDVRKALERFKV